MADSALKKLLYPISGCFALGSYLRWKLYRWGILPTKDSGAPVISVGNLAAGGTGKTPCTIRLAKALKGRGYSPVVLTRGYRRSSKERFISFGDDPGAALAGDEPALMSRKMPEIPIVVHADRHGSIEEIGADEGRVFILDDGFQRLRLKRDFDLVLLPAEDPFSGGAFLPVGGLRDGTWRLPEADALLSVGGGDIPELRFKAPGVPVFSARKIPLGLENLRGDSISAESLPEKRVVAFAGIANPSSFARSLEEMGFEVAAMVKFRDHHPYSPEDIRKVESRAEEVNADLLVTTEKDAVRLSGVETRLQTLVLKIGFEIGRENELLDLIEEKISG